MDKDNNFYPHVFTWEQFQRALLYTKKYYARASLFSQLISRKLEIH